MQRNAAKFISHNQMSNDDQMWKAPFKSMQSTKSMLSYQFDCQCETSLSSSIFHTKTITFLFLTDAISEIFVIEK